MLPVYFESFIPEYGDYRHNLRNDQIRLPLIRCEYGEMNVKYQMHLSLRELSTPSHPPKYPSIAINDETLSKSHSSFSRYIKDKFLSSYNIGYEPADLTVHPPRTTEGGLIFFV